MPSAESGRQWMRSVKEVIRSTIAEPLWWARLFGKISFDYRYAQVTPAGIGFRTLDWQIELPQLKSESQDRRLG